jgi:hypothetical protein
MIELPLVVVLPLALFTWLVTGFWAIVLAMYRVNLRTMEPHAFAEAVAFDLRAFFFGAPAWVALLLWPVSVARVLWAWS